MSLYPCEQNATKTVCSLPGFVSCWVLPGMRGREARGSSPFTTALLTCSFSFRSGALGKAPSKVTDALPEPEPSGAMAASEDEEEEEALEAMQSRLATLRS